MSCEKAGVQSHQITDVYVADFGSDDIKSCRPSDVDLNKQAVQAYFSRAKPIDYKVIHDHYNHAPCFIEGTLKDGNQVCEWEVRAGATGHIKCGEAMQYYVCDTCDDLFKAK